MKTKCPVPGVVHSEDRVQVYAGQEGRLVMCGFHASDPNIADALAKLPKEEAPWRTTQT